MDSEQIRKEVAVHLEIERQVREQLNTNENQRPAPKKSNWSWLESKVTLLVIGAMISGVLIPTFQFTQEKIKWRQQNKYNRLERQLDSIRQSLKQFIAVQGLSAELYNLGLDILDARSTTPSHPQAGDWEKRFRALQGRRIQQNAAFAATVFYFPARSRDSIRKAWNDLLLPAQKLETSVGNLLSGTTQGTYTENVQESGMHEIALQLDVSIVEVNQTYERVLALLRQQLVEVEDDSTKFQ